VDINMEHVFSRVRVKVDAHEIASAITAISGVEIVGGKSGVSLTVKDGDLTGGTEVTQSVTLTGPGTVCMNDAYDFFYPSPTKVTIGSMTMTIGGTDKTFSNLSAKFTEALAGGVNYTLVVDVRENRWAHSNIYWDETLNSGTGGLMFDKTATDSHPDYQGVFFKWGSLVGISPVGGASSGDVILYIPPVSGGNWDGTKKINSSGKPWSGTDYPAIPYIESATNNQPSWLYNHPDFTHYKGDICSYLTDGAWRLPNGSEGGVSADYDRSSFLSSAPNPNNPTGKGSMGAAGVLYNSAYGTTFFPASGERRASGGGSQLVAVGEGGSYWYGLMTKASMHGDQMLFYSFVANPGYWESTAFSCSIRCIKKLPSE
jgi:hypothetical protein